MATLIDKSQFMKMKRSRFVLQTFPAKPPSISLCLPSSQLVRALYTQNQRTAPYEISLARKPSSLAPILPVGGHYR